LIKLFTGELIANKREKGRFQRGVSFSFVSQLMRKIIIGKSFLSSKARERKGRSLRRNDFCSASEPKMDSQPPADRLTFPNNKRKLRREREKNILLVGKKHEARVEECSPRLISKHQKVFFICKLSLFVERIYFNTSSQPLVLK
jgi:hypothetical protein